MDEMPPRVADVLGAWDIPAPHASASVPAGTNNLSYRIEGAGRAYLLRIYQNTTDLARLADEHRLLQRLQGVALSFVVPDPLPTRFGTTLAPVGREGMGDGWAALFPVIPGHHPRAPDEDDTRAMGIALGELDAVLRALPSDFMHAPHALYGDLEHVHPLVAGSEDVVRDLSLGGERWRDYDRLIATIHAALPSLYGALPQQLIHSDFGRSNVLMTGGRVTGILDFEFAAPDLRALDFAIGLYHCACTTSGRFAVRWELVDAFAAGYGARVRLDRAEVDALPTLLRVRRVASILHRLGRHRAGLADKAAVEEQLGDTLLLHRWLLDHDTELMGRVWRWVIQ